MGSVRKLIPTTLLNTLTTTILVKLISFALCRFCLKVGGQKVLISSTNSPFHNTSHHSAITVKKKLRTNGHLIKAW